MDTAIRKYEEKDLDQFNTTEAFYTIVEFFLIAENREHAISIIALLLRIFRMLWEYILQCCRWGYTYGEVVYSIQYIPGELSKRGC